MSVDTTLGVLGHDQDDRGGSRSIKGTSSLIFYHMVLRHMDFMATFGLARGWQT